MTTDIVHHVQGGSSAGQTHVLIVGIGHYPHVASLDDVILDSLSSPPRTAKAIADWFITDFADPDRPLGSVSLVVSAEGPFGYRNPVTGNLHMVPCGSTNEIVDAVDGWASRAGANPQNRCVFYFCGHGLRIGTVDFLLTRSFGEKSNQFWDGVLRRSSIDSPMLRIGPSQQIFFYDTCRSEGSAVLGGDPQARIVLSTRRNSTGRSYQSRIFATAEGAAAHGSPGGLSLFAEEFLRNCSRSAVRRRAGGGWWVNTSDLQRHMERFVKQQRCQHEGDQLDLSFVGRDPGHIPVVLSSDPSETIREMNIECHREDQVAANFRCSDLAEDAPAEWICALSLGRHTFRATSEVEGAHPSVQGERWIEPPFAEVLLDMKGARIE